MLKTETNIMKGKSKQKLVDQGHRPEAKEEVVKHRAADLNPKSTITITTLKLGK